MPRKTSQGSAKDFFPDKLTLPSLREAAAGCKACDLWKLGTQTVFGEGRRRSLAMFIGEQPGNEKISRANLLLVPPVDYLIMLSTKLALIVPKLTSPM